MEFRRLKNIIHKLFFYSGYLIVNKIYHTETIYMVLCDVDPTSAYVWSGLYLKDPDMISQHTKFLLISHSKRVRSETIFLLWSVVTLTLVGVTPNTILRSGFVQSTHINSSFWYLFPNWSHCLEIVFLLCQLWPYPWSGWSQVPFIWSTYASSAILTKLIPRNYVYIPTTHNVCGRGDL